MGFMVGRDAEQHGIIRSGAKLVNAVSNATVPKITVIVGGSFGAGNYALCGKAFDPAFIFAWPDARYAVMGRYAGHRDAALTSPPAGRAVREEAFGGSSSKRCDARRLADYQAQTDIRYGAARGWVDAIIAPHATRDVLITRPATGDAAAAGGRFPGGSVAGLTSCRFERWRCLRIGNAQGFWGDAPMRPLGWLARRPTWTTSRSIIWPKCRSRSSPSSASAIRRSGYARDFLDVSNRSPRSGNRAEACGWSPTPAG